MTMNNKILGITLALVMLTGSIPLGFSEPLRVQLEQGLETFEIQCDNPNHVLVLRTSGDIACVTERNAERLGWEIIEISIIDDVLIGTTEVNTTDLQEQKQNLLEKIEQTNQEIQNIEIVIDGIYQERVLLEDEQVEEDNRTWDMIKDEQQNISNLELKITDYQIQIHQLSIEIYNLENPDKEPRLPIDLDIIDPSLAVYYISEQEAIEKASNFIQEAEYYFISESDGGKCGLVLDDPSNIAKYLENGVPYYEIYMGHCTHSIINVINGVIGPSVIMDGISGEEIYYSGGFY